MHDVIRLLSTSELCRQQVIEVDSGCPQRLKMVS